MIEMFKEWCDVRHQYAREWKRKTDGKVLGCFCTYVPEEILYAADVLPVRMLGSHEPRNFTDPHIFATIFPSCRDALGEGLKGCRDYVDGVVLSQSCLRQRQGCTSWDPQVPVEFSHYLPTPHHVQSPRAVAFTRAEFEVFKTRVEDWTGRKIGDDDMARGIEIVNESRRLMKRAYEQRKREEVPLTGLEAMYMVMSSQVIDKREHTPVLEGALGEMEGRSLATGTRLMLLGSENDDSAFVKMVESCDATVVQDEHCTGTRYFWDEVESQDDPLTAIAARYVSRIPCHSEHWPEARRIERIRQFATDWNAAGVIVVQQEFCGPDGIGIPAIRESLEEAGFETLFLERDASVPVDQIRMRVEVFLEILADDDLF